MSRNRSQALTLHDRDDDVPNDASRDAQPGPSGSKQPLAASASLNTTAAAKPAKQAKKAPKLAQQKRFVSVLGKSAPAPKVVVSGPGSKKGDSSYGGNGRALAWYHEHWQPADTDKYPGEVHKDNALRKRLEETVPQPPACTASFAWQQTQRAQPGPSSLPPTSRTIYRQIVLDSKRALPTSQPLCLRSC